MPRRVPLVAIVILDGWGCAPPGPGNAVELAATPVFDRLWREYPHTTLGASGEAVGLPPGQMGNSEVGHLTIGSGRVLDQVGALEQRGAKLIGKGSKPPNSTDFGHQLRPVHHTHDLIDVPANQSGIGQRKPVSLGSYVCADYI